MISQILGDIELRLRRTHYEEFGLRGPVSYTK